MSKTAATSQNTSGAASDLMNENFASAVDMKIKLRCPNLRCKSILSVPPHFRGKAVRCGICGQSLVVPNVKKDGKKK